MHEEKGEEEEEVHGRAGWRAKQRAGLHPWRRWGAKVKMPVDMPDDMLRDAINVSRELLDECEDFNKDGKRVHSWRSCMRRNSSHLQERTGTLPRNALLAQV